MTEKKNTVTALQVAEVLNNSEIKAMHYNGKTTIVTVTLPNGFIIVESSSCVDPANYDPVLGEKICLDRVRDKIWELEGYVLQSKVAGLL